MQHTDENGNKMIIRADLTGTTMTEYVRGRINEFVNLCLTNNANSEIKVVIYNMCLNKAYIGGLRLGFTAHVRCGFEIYMRRERVLTDAYLENAASEIMNMINIDDENELITFGCIAEDTDVLRYRSYTYGYDLTTLFKSYLYDVSCACMSCGEMHNSEENSVNIIINFVDNQFTIKFYKLSAKIYFNNCQYKTIEYNISLREMRKKLFKVFFSTDQHNMDTSAVELIESDEFKLFVIELCNFDELLPVRKCRVRPAAAGCGEC